MREAQASCQASSEKPEHKVRLHGDSGARENAVLPLHAHASLTPGPIPRAVFSDCLVFSHRSFIAENG